MATDDDCWLTPSVKVDREELRARYAHLPPDELASLSNEALALFVEMRTNMVRGLEMYDYDTSSPAVRVAKAQIGRIERILRRAGVTV